MLNLNVLNLTATDTWNRAKENLKTLYQLRVKSAFEYAAKNQVFIQSSRYEIETVTEFKDLMHLLNIRANDSYDTKADHVLIRDKKNMKTIGSLRVLSSHHSEKFSSEEAFDLSDLKQSSFGIIELSRLNLLPEHRHMEVFNLIASYLSQYALKDSAEYLICNQSINSGSSRSAVLAHKYFESMNAASPLSLTVKSDFQVPNFEHWKGFLKGPLSKSELEEIEQLLPPILKESLALGANIAEVPSLDKCHNRIDFLTILHKEDLNRALWKKSPSHSELSYAFSYS